MRPDHFTLPATEHEPLKIGGYVVTKAIGAGAFGQVWHAHAYGDPEWREAIKIAIGDKSSIDRFAYEAKKLHALADEPHVVTCKVPIRFRVIDDQTWGVLSANAQTNPHDVAEQLSRKAGGLGVFADVEAEDLTTPVLTHELISYSPPHLRSAIDSTYGAALVLELATKGNLADLIDTRQLDSDEVLRLATHISAGLAALHNRGYPHLDIKPDNILLFEDSNTDWFAKVADLGCRPLQLADDITQSRSGKSVVSSTWPSSSRPNSRRIGLTQAGANSVTQSKSP